MSTLKLLTVSEISACVTRSIDYLDIRCCNVMSLSYMESEVRNHYNGRHKEDTGWGVHEDLMRSKAE